MIYLFTFIFKYFILHKQMLKKKEVPNLTSGNKYFNMNSNSTLTRKPRAALSVKYFAKIVKCSAIIERTYALRPVFLNENKYQHY